jgi:hypothetical protein
MADSNGTPQHEHAAQIIRRLNKRGVGKKCPMCASKDFRVFPSFFAPFLSDDASEASDFKIEKRLYPCIGLVCTNCGFTSQHSLEALGLMALFDK